MVSQTQVYALHRLLETQINRFYNEKINTLENELIDLKEEMKHNILKNWNTIAPNLRANSLFINNDGSIAAVLSLPEHDIEVIESYVKTKEELTAEWQETLELLETWKNLALIGKDYLINPPTLPERLKKFLDAALLEMEE